MTTDRPPSSRPHPSGDAELSQARGQLRNALGGLKNLDQLLRSIRVGPKAVASVVPDVLASCGAIRTASDQLLDALARDLPQTKPIDELRAFIDPRVRELEGELAAMRKKQMTAKHRLTLERVVTRLSNELDAARELIDLLEDAVWGPTVRVDLRELVRESMKPAVREADLGTTLRTTLGLPKEPVEVFVNPRVVMGFLSIGVRLVTPDAVSKSHIELGPNPPRISIRAGPGEGESVSVAARMVIGPTVVCVESAARRSGVVLQRGPSQIELSWPASSAPGPSPA